MASEANSDLISEGAALRLPQSCILTHTCINAYQTSDIDILKILGTAGPQQAISWWCGHSLHTGMPRLAAGAFENIVKLDARRLLLMSFLGLKSHMFSNF